jgi:pimeloyl-ACP methyl ester carboxylesterase
MNANPLPSGRPLVVCLHSSGASSRQWLPLAERVARAFHVVAPDLHGHGSGPAWLGAPAGIVDADVARVARLLSIDRRAHLVGHSYGGVVALKLALAWPERVRSVTVYEPVAFRLLHDFAPRSGDAAEASDVGRGVQRDLRAGLAVQAARRFVDYWSGAGTFEAMPPSRREAIAHRMGAIAAHFVSLWEDTMRLADVARVTAPLTILIGDRTRPPTRRIAELLRHARPDARFGALTAMGHTGPLTHPAIVAQRIESEIVGYERGEASALRRLAA